MDKKNAADDAQNIEQETQNQKKQDAYTTPPNKATDDVDADADDMPQETENAKKKAAYKPGS